MNTSSNRNAYILIALIPVCVYFLSTQLFEVNAETSVSIKNAIVTAIKQQQTPNTTLVFTEYKSRLLWLCSSLLSISAYLVAIAWSAYTFKRCCNQHHKTKITIIGLIIMMLTLLNLNNGSADSAMFNIFDTTFQAANASALISKPLLTKVFVIVYVINVLAGITPSFILVAICSAISTPAQAPEALEDFFVSRMKYLNQGIMVGSLILLFGVIHLVAWMQWPTSMFENNELNKLALDAFGTISQYWGIAFTLQLLCLYVAVTLYWYRQTHSSLIAQQPTMDIDRWMADHGFVIAWQKHVLQLSTMLTPFLAGSFTSGIDLFSGN